MELVAIVFACIGVVASIIWLVLAVRGIRTLQDIREELARRRKDEGGG